MATIFIWNNNVVTTGHGYPGHSSMNMDDNWRKEGGKNYVSLWPQIPGDQPGASIMSGSHGAISNNSVEDDVKSEGGYVPDHIIRLNGTDVLRMVAEWQAAKKEYVVYNMLRTNCSAAVARVLKAGSSAGGTLKRNNLVWTPLKVKRLALAMGGTKISWASFLDEFVACGALSRESAGKLKDQPKRSSKHGSSTVASTHNGSYRFDKPTDTTWIRPAMSTGGAMLNTPMMNSLFDDIDDAMDG